MKIRRRLALYGAMVTAAGMIGFGILLSALAGRAAPTDQDAALASLAEATAEAVTSAAEASLIPTRPPILIDMETSTDPYVAIVETDGTVLYTTGQVGGAMPRIPAAALVEALETGASTVTTTVGSAELRLHVVPWQRPDLDRAGVVVAGQSLAFTEEQLAGLRAVLWVAGIITLVAATVVSWLVSGRALRPLRALVETTDDIGATGDLSRRLPPTKADDEVGALTTSFNGMLDRLATTRSELQESLAAQRRFVADASHELRSPLTTIRNNAGFLMDRPDAAAADRAEATADIGEEAARMATLVDDLLMLARADAVPDIERRPVDLAAVAADVARKSIRDEQPFEAVTSGPAVVMGDRAALTRLVRVLIDNARKHGAAPTVVRVGTSQGAATLTVHDAGPGVPEPDLPHVFDRFFRVDPARSPAGAGLGLSIAYEIVSAHGGTISAANHDDGGLVVTATLPAA